MSDLCLFDIAQLAPAPASQTYPLYDGKVRAYIPYEKPPYAAAIPADWLTDRRWWGRLAWLGLEEFRADFVVGGDLHRNRLVHKAESAQWVCIRRFIPGETWTENRAIVTQSAAGNQRRSALAQLVHISVTKAEFDRAHIPIPDIPLYRTLETR